MKRFIAILLFLASVLCSCTGDGAVDRIEMRDGDSIYVSNNGANIDIYDSWESEIKSLVKSINNYDGEMLSGDTFLAEDINMMSYINIAHNDGSLTLLSIYTMNDADTGAVRVIEQSADEVQTETCNFVFVDEDLYTEFSEFILKHE